MEIINSICCAVCGKIGSCLCIDDEKQMKKLNEIMQAVSAVDVHIVRKAQQKR